MSEQNGASSFGAQLLDFIEARAPQTLHEHLFGLHMAGRKFTDEQASMLPALNASWRAMSTEARGAWATHASAGLLDAWQDIAFEARDVPGVGGLSPVEFDEIYEIGRPVNDHFMAMTAMTSLQILVALRMTAAGLEEDFIVQALRLAQVSEGVEDLLHLWLAAAEPRALAEGSIREAINDRKRKVQ